MQTVLHPMQKPEAADYTAVQSVQDLPLLPLVFPGAIFRKAGQCLVIYTAVRSLYLLKIIQSMENFVN